MVNFVMWPFFSNFGRAVISYNAAKVVIIFNATNFLEINFNTMTKFNDRIQAIARIEGLSINEMERIIGASKGVLSRAIKNDTDIQAKWVFALCENFTKFSPEWLLTGKGEPLCKREPVITENSDHAGIIKELVQIIKEKDEQIIEMATEIGELRAEIKQLKDRLQKSVDAVCTETTANAG